MARLFDGINDWLQSASDFDYSATNKLTVSFWCWMDDQIPPNFDLLLEVTPDMNASQVGFYFSPYNPINALDLTMKGDVGNSSALFSLESLFGEWFHVALTLDKSLPTNEVNVWKDGALLTPSSRPSNSDNTNNFGISPWYFMSRAGTTLFAPGRLAEFAIYPDILTADDIIQLAAGFQPLFVRRDLNPRYWPLLGQNSPETFMLGDINLAVNGATQAPTHPPMIYQQ